MKAIKVIEPYKVEIVEIPKPEIIKDDDVIIRVTSGGICGSDIQIWNGTNSLATYPRIIGHEFGGIVEAVGKGVTKVKAGDKAAVDPVVSCGHCYACEIGRPNVCSSLEVLGVHRDGGFAEYVKADESNVHRFNSDFNEILLGLVEPYTIGVQINSRAKISKDDLVLIMGSGPIGICAMQVAKQNGARVMMTDILKPRLDRAKVMGADEVVLISEDRLEDRIEKFTSGKGIPVIVDTVCTPSSLEESVKLAGQAGRVVCIGLKNAPSAISMAEITKKELTIVGSRLNNNCFDQVIEGFEKGYLQPELLMTDVYSFRDITDAIRIIQEYPQNVLKVVLKFGQ